MGRMLRFLAARAIPGVEMVTGGTYRRNINLPNGTGVIALRPAGDPQASHIECELQLQDLRDVAPAVQRCRRLLDLDADPAAVTAFLSRSETLRPAVAACPGRRVPGHVDGDELAIRAVLGQQVSVAAARRLGARLTAAYGKPLGRPVAVATGNEESGGAAEASGAGGAAEASGAGGAAEASGAGGTGASRAAGAAGDYGLTGGPTVALTHCFPAAETLAAADPASLPMPRSRARALVGLATALASGTLTLDPGASRDDAEARLLALPGIGPWTTGYIRMRALSDPDAFLPTDAGVRHGLTALGAGSDPASAARQAGSWRPWRSYALQHLWAITERENS